MCQRVVAISLRGVSFSWKHLPPLSACSNGSGGDGREGVSTSSDFCLRDINVEVKVGHLTAVIGSVGAGKSSFLAALLGAPNTPVCVNEFVM